MGSMPNWFAKTKEMAAFDRYFSTRDVDEKGLLDRYLQALGRMQGRRLLQPGRRAASTEWARSPNPRHELRVSLDEHFRGDWIHHLYPDDPGKYGDVGGRFWPQVPSHDVIERLRAGVVFAIHKAMGDTELANLGPARGLPRPAVEGRARQRHRRRRRHPRHRAVVELRGARG